MTGPARSRGNRADELAALLSVLAHDLRTPLTPVRGYAEILRTRGHALGPEKTVEYATIISEAAARMERSVDLLSGISALYTGRADVRPERVRAADLVAERLDIWRGRQPARSFAADIEGTHGAVLVDRGWLGKVLDVFLDQAVRSWPPATPIVIGARTDVRGGATRLGVGTADPVAQAAPLALDRLGTAFANAVSETLGYPFAGPLEILVPPSAE